MSWGRAASSTGAGAAAHPRAAHAGAPKQTCRSQNHSGARGDDMAELVLAAHSPPDGHVHPCLRQTLQKAKPHISKRSAKLFAPSPQGLSQQLLFVQRGRLNGSRYSISKCLFSVEVCVLVCKRSHFRQAANVLPGITESGHPKYKGFAAAACLLDLFISFCYN